MTQQLREPETKEPRYLTRVTVYFNDPDKSWITFDKETGEVVESGTSHQYVFAPPEIFVSNPLLRQDEHWIADAVSRIWKP